MPTVIELPDLKPLIRRLKDNCDDINDEFESYNVLLSRELKIKLVNDLNKKSSEGNKNKKYKAEIDGDYVKFQMEDGIVGTEPFLSFIMVAHAIELKKTYKVYLEQAYKVKEGLKSEFSEKDFETVGGENNLDSKLKKRIKEEIGGLGALSENSKILLIKFMTATKEKRIDEFGNYKGLYRSDTLDPVFSSAMNILVQRFTYVEKMFDVIDQDLEVELKNLKLSGFGKLVLGREDLDLNEFAFLSFKELMKKFTIEQLLDESSTTKCTQWGKYNLINLTVGAENSGEKYTLQNLIGLYASEDIDKNNKHLYSGDKIRFQKDKLDSVYFGSSLFSYYFSSEWGHDYPNKLNFKNFKAYVEKVSKGRYKLDCYLKDSSKPKDFTYLLIDLGVQNHPLNQILYGPPGSGKTYNAVNHALSIALKKDLKSLIESQKGNDRQRKSDKKDFDGLLKDGQIRFVTFHQSYSYEDFVEGIKPRVVKNNIEYHVEPCFFKQIC